MTISDLHITKPRTCAIPCTKEDPYIRLHSTLKKYYVFSTIPRTGDAPCIIKELDDMIVSDLNSTKPRTGALTCTKEVPYIRLHATFEEILLL